MNGLNSLDNPTINGLRSLTLDQLDANIINSGVTFFEGLEVTNIIIENQLILNSEATILANGENINGFEISQLKDIEYNIQTKFNIIDENLTNINGNLSVLEDAVTTLQEEVDSIPDSAELAGLLVKTQNQTASVGTTTFSGDMRLTNLYFASNPFQYQDVAFTGTEKTKLSWLNIDSTELLINQIRFIDDIGTSAVQRTAFTSFLRSLIFTNSGNIGNLQDKTANLTRGGTITHISGALTTPIISIGTQINFPDSSVQTTAYIPTSPILTQYSGDALVCLGQVINSAGTWYNFDYTWEPTSLFLTPGMYTINLMMTLGKINELERVESYMYITRSGATVEESFESGIYLKSATAQREKYNYNLQFIFKSEHSNNLLKVYTKLHMKASSLSYFLGKVQILKQ